MNFPDCSLSLLQVKNHRDQLHLKERQIACAYRSSKRANEFSTGRFISHLAIRSLGYLDLPIGIGERGQPLWPPPVVASLAHNDQWAGCLIAHPFSGIRSLGFDFESTSRVLGESLFPTLFSVPEIRLIQQGQPDRAMALFCLKEAIYKCLNQQVGPFIGFHEVEVVELDPNQFKANVVAGSNLARSVSFAEIEGRLFFEGGMVLAAVGLRSSGEWVL